MHRASSYVTKIHVRQISFVFRHLQISNVNVNLATDSQTSVVLKFVLISMNAVWESVLRIQSARIRSEVMIANAKKAIKVTFSQVSFEYVQETDSIAVRIRMNVKHCTLAKKSMDYEAHAQVCLLLWTYYLTLNITSGLLLRTLFKWNFL